MDNDRWCVSLSAAGPWLDAGATREEAIAASAVLLDDGGTDANFFVRLPDGGIEEFNVDAEHVRFLPPLG